jgi:putative Mn2+ efflux pump MntP
MKTFEFIFGNFWHWLGFVILIVLIGKYIYVFVYNTYQRTLRHFTIMKYGYPPNCDADGDFNKLEEEAD